MRQDYKVINAIAFTFWMTFTKEWLVEFCAFYDAIVVNAQYAVRYFLTLKCHLSDGYLFSVKVVKPMFILLTK